VMAWINQQAWVIRAPPLPRRERPHASRIRALAEGKKAKEREGKEETGRQKRAKKERRLWARASPKAEHRD